MNNNTYNFSGFIWSPAKQFQYEILEYINKLFPVLHYYTYEFNDIDFEKSVLDIYTTDDIDLTKVKNIKIKNMINHSPSYIYFKFYIENPNFRIKKSTGNKISTVVENLKRQIRDTYKTKIVNYIHDIIIHISDNFQQTKDIDTIIKKYEHFRKHEFINLKYFLKRNFDGNIFDRVDILVRKYSIEEYLKNKSYDFSIYKKMQQKRTGKNPDFYVRVFKNLIQSLINNGFDVNYPIKCSHNNLLIDGSHRTSFLYFKQQTFIPIKTMFRNNHRSYSINWFINNKFSNNELTIINKTLNEFMHYISN